MEEDDDAFLYGDDGNEAKSIAVQEIAALKAELPIEISNGEAEDAMQAEEDEEEDESEEDDDSDSDLEIIVDGTAGPPAGYNARQAVQPTRAIPIQRAAPSVITSDYTPNARPGQTSTASTLAALTGLDVPTEVVESNRTAPQLNNRDVLSMSDLPEGPSPPVPMTAPRLDLDPPEQALMLPPETVEDEPGPLIYHVDPTELEEKPWRKPGADLTDWFNYGFNEESWRLWGDKKYSRTMDRRGMEANGGRGGMIDNGPEEMEQQNDDSSNYMSQMPQQIQAMQAMMGASGSSMSPEQMMAFMGMGSGGMPGMGMMGMPNMAAMFGQQQSNPFASGFPAMGNMPMMQAFQSGQIGDGSLMRFVNNNGNNFNDNNDQNIDSKEQVEEEEEYHPNGDTASDADYKIEQDNGQGEQQEQMRSREPSAPAGDTRSHVHDNEASKSSATDDVASNAGSTSVNASNRGGMSIQGRGAASNIPTGPSSRSTSIPKGPSADRSNNGANNLPNNVPTGPKNPGRRYNDRDNGSGVADSLDYGANAAYRERENSGGRSPRYGRNRSRERSRRDQSMGSREVSTDRDRDREDDRNYRRDRERTHEERDAHTSSRRTTRDRGSERKRASSPEDEMDRLSSRRDRRGDDRKTSNTSQRHSTRRGDHREESYEREDDWDRQSVDSTASRRRTSTRHQSGAAADAASSTRKTTTRSDRRRGADEVDSGSETEKERKPGRSQARADRRAGRDHNDGSSKTSSRKRSAPEDDLSPVRTTSSRKRR